jgi:acetyl-CoA carboxylase carboxyltransferase component
MVKHHLRINSGHQIGIIANQTPVLFSKESQKAVQFIRLSNQSSTPILFMHNVTGFMVGKKTEREGLIKSGSLFVDAVSRSQVPHLSVICGASYGAGNYAVRPLRSD